ncbi:hypothetical protein C1I99_18305 [Micromonospora deserti]|uniref:MmpS family protein n=1 Tax=Micromonospora deserti TaxID=2070366 RepID=A0A2W2CCI9_9ACTN|nr:hypothetical protein C1I99_18305 [Micromonospora deserti]
MPPVHLPPGYPPPYGPPAPPRGSTTRSTVIGIVVAAATVLVFGFCACLGVAGWLVGAEGRYSGDPYAEEPYYDPYDDDEEPEVGGWPTAESTPTLRPAQTPSDGPGKVTVVYEVTGDGPADLEYYDANGDFIQVERVKLPWRQRLRMHDDNRVMVLASNSDGEATIACRVTVDGARVAEDASDWAVNCTG